ncbi:hypothetical protein RB594_008410 [Gaeumannomyces avenae]
MLLVPVENMTHRFELPLKGQYEDPTYENIVRVLADVPNYAENDLVYIHYSGHGGQASTVFAKLKKNSDDIDHSLLPPDIALVGKCLRDVELGALLQDIIIEVGVVLTVPTEPQLGAIYDRVCAKIQNAVPNQTPYLVGDHDRFFFGPKHRSAWPAASGVKEKAEYAILPLTFDLGKCMTESDVLARVKIERVRTGTSDATFANGPGVNPPSRREQIRKGCPAVLQILPLEAQATVCFLAADEEQWRRFEQGWTQHTGGRSQLRLLARGKGALVMMLSPDGKYSEDEFIYPADDIPSRNGVYEVPERRLFRVTVTNKTDFKVGCTILNFVPKFGISIISPKEGTSPFHTILIKGKLVEDLGVVISDAL